MSELVRVKELKGINLPRALNPHYLPQDAEKGYKFFVERKDDSTFAYMFSFPAYCTLIWSGKPTLHIVERNFKKIMRELVVSGLTTKEEEKNIKATFWVGDKEIQLPYIVKPYFGWEKKLHDAYQFFVTYRAHAVTDIEFRSGKDSWNYKLSYSKEGWHFSNNQISFSTRTLQCDAVFSFLQKTSIARLSDEELKEFRNILESLSDR